MPREPCEQKRYNSENYSKTTLSAVIGTKQITITATDAGGKSSSATVTIIFVDASVMPAVVDDRDWRFIGIP